MCLVFLPSLLNEFRERRIIGGGVIRHILPKFSHEDELVVVGKLLESWKAFDNHGLSL